MLEAVVSTIDELTSGLSDSAELLDMSVEEQDEDGVESVVEELDQLSEKLELLEFRRMFSGEMDPNNALPGYPGRLRRYRGPGLGQHAVADVPALG